MSIIDSNFVVHSPFKPIDFSNSDLWTFLKTSFKDIQDNIAIEDIHNSHSVTFRELQNLSQRFAETLYQYGFDSAIPFALCLGNSIEFVVALLAVWRLHGKIGLISPLLTPGEIKQKLLLLDAKFIFADTCTINNVLKAVDDTTVKYVISKEPMKECLSFSMMLNQHGITKNLPTFKHENSLIGSTALIPFSSGTTGLSKGVELSHASVVEQVCYFRHNCGMDILKKVGVLYQPLSHMYGLTILLSYLSSGNKIVLMERFNLKEYIRIIAKLKIELMFIVPPIAVQFCKSGLIEEYDLSAVKFIMTTSAPLKKEVELEMKNTFSNKVKTLQGYGLTETTCLAVIIPTHSEKECPFGSVGWPNMRTQVKVIDISSGKNLGPGRNGELCLKNNYLMKGYVKNRHATENTVDRDGWLHTGDVGYYDESGCFYIVDRIKEMIKYKAYQVAPAELDSVLLTHPKISDVGVSSIPDLEAGELPYAWVVLKPNTHMSKDELHLFIKERVAPYKRLRGGIEFVKAIPKTSTGKILRRLIQPKHFHSKL